MISKKIITLKIWFLFFVSIETFENHPNCGRLGVSLDSEQRPSDRIVGGKDTNITAFPFQASIISGDRHSCGATILNKRWFLTASHCSPKPNKSVVIGSTELDDRKHIYPIQLAVLNGCYEQLPGHDIALFKTETDIIQIDLNDSNIGSICLPEANSEPSSRRLYHTGWGIYQESGFKAPNILQMAETELFGEKYCTFMNAFTNLGLYEMKESGDLCVQSLDNQACFGDSGGPLFEVINGTAVEVGITAMGTGSDILLHLSIHCDRNEGVIYTKVSKYMDWIDAVIKEYDESDKKAQMTTICEPGKPFKFKEIE